MILLDRVSARERFFGTAVLHLRGEIAFAKPPRSISSGILHEIESILRDGCPWWIGLLVVE
jgi:hypothetical protein